MKIPHVMEDYRRRTFESVIDILYLLNVVITPFIGLDRKYIDKRLQKEFYPV